MPTGHLFFLANPTLVEAPRPVLDVRHSRRRGWEANAAKAMK